MQLVETHLQVTTSLDLNANMESTYVHSLLNLLSNIIICVIAPVFTCFLDASKAYDRVNHWTLCKKLLKSSVSIPVVRVLMLWYSKQEVCIRWRIEMSYFNISNGVRQGGILSPFLFALYMNDLSSLLKTSRIGCHICDACINHVFYVDDLCLMAPCAIALQELINICRSHSIKINLKCNATKSFYMIFTPRNYKLLIPLLY